MEQPSSTNTSYNFLTGGGEMGALTRSYDWSKTSIGEPFQWPHSLRTMVSVLLNSGFPMFLFWSDELIQFYNDAYRPSLGKEGKHPSALGSKAVDTWEEIWPVIKPLIDRVLAGGEATWSEDQLIPIYRNGCLEDVYWTFSYSPVPDDTGKVAGVLVTCTETTKTVEAIKNMENTQRDTLAYFEQSDIAIATVSGKDFIFRMVNPFYGELVGRKPADLINKPLLEALPELKDQGFDLILKEVLETGVPYIAKAVPAELMRKGVLEKIYVDLSYHPKKDDSNRPDGIFVVATDVTEQVLSRKKIEESEEKARLAIKSADLALYEIIYATNELIPDKRFNDIWGFDHNGSREEYAAAIHPDDAEARQKAHEASLVSGHLDYRARLIWPDQSLHWVRITGTIIFDDHGAPLKLIGFAEDITPEMRAKENTEEIVAIRTKELKELNSSLKKSEERYHLMVEEVQDYAILYLNPEGTVENWNQGAEKIKGYKANEIIGKNFSSFYTASDRENNLPQKLLKMARDTGKATQQGWRVRKDGTLFWASVVITAVHDEANNVIGFSKVTHDLTEKKQADDRIKSDAMQLKKKNTELEKMNKELESFAYISGHDLQEPLRKIRLFSEQILAGESDRLSAEGRDKFSRIQRAAQRMQTLINDLLEYSRTATSERVFEKTNLKALTEDVKDDLREEIKAQDASIEIGNMCSAVVIPFQFRQLLYNLMSNAIKFKKENRPPVIKISAESVPAANVHREKPGSSPFYCHIKVADNGIGFEPEYRDKIFEVFQRLHGKHEFTGTGIGLAIVKKIVDNHDGMITAGAVPGEGAVFDIYLPMN